ncbi:uncharacterized protein LOC143255951 isoform X3 [Tachypleus tridentatus]
MAKKNASGNSVVRYHKISQIDDGFVDLQFEKPQVKIPWKAITLAVFLFVVGIVLIIIGSLLLTGYIDAKVWMFRLNITSPHSYLQYNSEIWLLQCCFGVLNFLTLKKCTLLDSLCLYNKCQIIYILCI